MELAKDVAAMQSNPDGGYVVVGANDHGEPVPCLTQDLASYFDESTLRPKLSKYISNPDVRSAQYEVNGNLLVLIRVAASEVGWCIFSRDGEYTDSSSGKTRTVFLPAAC